MTCSPGSPLGDGLTPEAAADLGLDPGTAVGASLIDAHAGGLGTVCGTCFLVVVSCRNLFISLSPEWARQRKPLFASADANRVAVPSEYRRARVFFCCVSAGVIGADVKGFRLPCEGRPITTRMAMICGTSSCHMAVSVPLLSFVYYIFFNFLNQGYFIVFIF